MTYPPTKNELIEKAFMDAMYEYPEKDKHEIITIVTDQGFPRPSVRRVKGDLLIKLIKYTRILK